MTTTTKSFSTHAPDGSRTPFNPLEEIAHAHSSVAGTDNRVQLIFSASQYGMSQRWLDTTFVVSGNKNLDIHLAEWQAIVAKHLEESAQ